jgi:hypothetical protein
VDEAEAVLAWLMKPDAGASVDELLAALVAPPIWHRDTACRGKPTKWFFPALVGDPKADKGSQGPVRQLPGGGRVFAVGPR